MQSKGGQLLLLFDADPAVTALDKLHAKHVLPGFNDRSKEEAEIERQTADITRVGAAATKGKLTRRTFDGARLSLGLSVQVRGQHAQRLSPLPMPSAASHKRCRRHPGSSGRSSECTCKVGERRLGHTNVQNSRATPSRTRTCWRRAARSHYEGATGWTSWLRMRRQ